MQVSNNCQSPNFGMALKIKGGKEYLATKTEKALNDLVQIGEEMKDYKHWDLFVTDHGYQAVEKNQALPHIYGISVSTPGDDFINKLSDRIKIKTYIDGNYANKGEQVSLVYDNVPAKEVEDLKDACKGWDGQESFAEFVRFLEKRSAENAAKEAKVKAETERINGLVDDLVSKFSVDA